MQKIGSAFDFSDFSSILSEKVSFKNKAAVVELADTHDSKSCGRKPMRVQVPPAAPGKALHSIIFACDQHLSSRSHETAFANVNGIAKNPPSCAARGGTI